MCEALRLAARARGRTAPNPLVGALVVRGGELVWLNADADLLQQCVINIIRNAIDASAAGREVTVSWSEEGMFGCVAVEDRGVGMSPQVRASEPSLVEWILMGLASDNPSSP